MSNFKSKSKIERFDRNEYIRVPRMMVIGENGERLGEFERYTAIDMARENGLDLVLISPNTQPPVAKIMEWSKFKYEQSKKQKESKGKKTDTKEMRFKPKIEAGDIEHKVKRVKEFIDKGDRVKITIQARGRVSRDQIKDTMQKVLDRVLEFSTKDGEPKFEGYNYAVFIKKS